MHLLTAVYLLIYSIYYYCLRESVYYNIGILSFRFRCVRVYNFSIFPFLIVVCIFEMQRKIFMRV